jgi:hypothetical protein
VVVSEGGLNLTPTGSRGGFSSRNVRLLSNEWINVR